LKGQEIMAPNLETGDNYNKNSSGDEIANVNFLYDDIAHVLQNTEKRTYFV